MSDSAVQLNNNSTPGAKVKTFTSLEGPTTVHVQAVAIADPTSGDPVAVASESTMAAILARQSDGTQRVRAAASDAVRTSVAASLTDVVLLLPNSARKGMILYNDSLSILYIGLGTATVSSTNFSYIIAAENPWEGPPGFIGEIRGVWVTADGNARVTELA